jgi:outer membrane lipoprotein LolB
MMRHCRAMIMAAVCGALLAGCATGPRSVPDDRQAAWAEHRQALEALSGWRAEGRLAVQAPGDAGNANFVWVENGDGHYRLRLEGPLGQGGGRLEVNEDRAVLTTGDGQRYAGADAGALLADLYGWNIPVSGLRHWLVGLPGAGADYELDRFGRITALDWRGWHIEYRRYRQVGDLDLPATLIATGHDSGTEIRVAIDRWRPRADEGAPVDEDGSTVPLMGS